MFCPVSYRTALIRSSIGLIHRTALGLLLTAFAAHTALAQGSAGTAEVFTDGTVAIYCDAVDQAAVPESVFNAAFPGWIVDLQGYADTGKIIRAHYLPNFRGGIFIVVDGEDLEDARSNADEILAKHTEVLTAAWSATEMPMPTVDPCTLIDIGPVAILPR